MKKARFAQSCLRRLTVVFAVCVIGTFGAVEHGQLGWMHRMLQSGLFRMLTAACFTANQAIERRIRRWKRR